MFEKLTGRIITIELVKNDLIDKKIDILGT